MIIVVFINGALDLAEGWHVILTMQAILPDD